MREFIIYRVDCAGNSSNCLYRTKTVITDKSSFQEAVTVDHVTAK